MRFLLLHAAAGSDPRRLERHLSGQAEALSDFSLSISSKTIGPFRASNADLELVQILHWPTMALIGGVCLQVRKPGVLLPSEEQLRDPELIAEVASRSAENPSELCGCWIARDFRKRGLLPYLVGAGVAVARLRGSGLIIGSTHSRAAPTYEALGVRIDHDRVFAWPDERYRTHIARIGVEEYLGAPKPHARTARAILAAFGKGREYEFAIGRPQLAECRA